MENKYELQVTKIFPENKFTIEDFTVLAGTITANGSDCAIFRTPSGIVLMRAVDETETVITREDGKICKKPYRDAKTYPLRTKRLGILQIMKVFKSK